MTAYTLAYLSSVCKGLSFNSVMLLLKVLKMALRKLFVYQLG